MLPLKIARLKRASRVLGPGCRAIIWTHGCSRGCPHCIAEEMNEAPHQFEHTAVTLYEWLESIEGIEGVTITGGEPFEQDIETLGDFLQLVKHDSRRLSTMCYTGKSMTELLNDDKISRILKYIDIVIDGPYIHELNAGHKWRGSSNQKIYPLTDEYASLVSDAENCFDREIEISMSSKMQFELTGIPSVEFMYNLDRKLHESGYYLYQGRK